MTKLQDLKKQIEFYFSDCNYRKDKFLYDKCTQEGGLSIPILLTFKRIEAWGCTADEIKECLKDSAVVKIEDDKLVKIETESYKKYMELESLDDRVVFMRGFGKNMSLDEIEAYLKEHFEPKLIRMRRDAKKAFNGDILVEVESPDIAAKVLETEFLLSKEEEATDENLQDEKEDSKRKKPSGEPKRVKVKLTVMMKREYFTLKKENDKKEKIKKEIEAEFKDRIFDYKAEKEMNIKEIKTLIENVAFVDTKESVLRFKRPQDFKEKEFVDAEGNKITLSKMSEEKEIEYISKIKIEKPLKKKTRRNKK